MQYNSIQKELYRRLIKMLEVIALVSLAVIAIKSICEFLGLIGIDEDKSSRESCSGKN